MVDAFFGLGVVFVALASSETPAGPSMQLTLRRYKGKANSLAPAQTIQRSFARVQKTKNTPAGNCPTNTKGIYACVYYLYAMYIDVHMRLYIYIYMYIYIYIYYIHRKKNTYAMSRIYPPPPHKRTPNPTPTDPSKPNTPSWKRSPQDLKIT